MARDAELLGYVQPAFAARALSLDPLDLDGRWLPQGARAGEPWLVVPVETEEALARARFRPDRLRDLVLRQRFVGAIAVRVGPPLLARCFVDDGEVAPPGDASAALEAWLAAK